MNDNEIKKLYEQVEAEIDNLKVGSTREYDHPEFTTTELLTIRNIVEYFKDAKYKDSITFEVISIRIKVTKVQPQETSVFLNATFEDPESIKAEKAYNNCKSNNHNLLQSNQTTFGNPILICKKCRLGYTYKLNSGKTSVQTVFKI